MGLIVAVIVEDHDDNHENSIARGKDVERGSAHVLCFKVELQVTIESR